MRLFTVAGAVPGFHRLPDSPNALALGTCRRLKVTEIGWAGQGAKASGGNSVILYLHGLNSSGASHKGQVLREHLAPIRVLSPTYPAHLHEQAVNQLADELRVRVKEAERQAQPLLLVGSSMGGFYGQYLARQFPVDHLVMINPALQPWEVLRQVVGWQNNLALSERYYLSEEMVAATRRYDIEEVDDGVPTTLLLDKGDELIDWRIAESIYAGIGDLHCFEGGNHAFEHIQEAAMIIARIHRDLEAEKR